MTMAKRWTLALTLAAVAVAGSAWTGGVRAEEETPTLSRGNADRFLFTAVLEGLLEERPGEAVKPILAKTEKGRYRHFVYACPSCTPVLEAFRCYAGRDDWFFSRKGEPYGEVGLVLSAADGADLAKGEDAGVRRVLGSMVTRYTRRQMDRRRLTKEERAMLEQVLEEFRKKGMATLGQYRGSDSGDAPPDMKDCPSCDGAVEGSIPR